MSDDGTRVLLAEITRLRVALAEIAAHDTGMHPDFSMGARQAWLAREALKRDRRALLFPDLFPEITSDKGDYRR